MMVGHTHDDIDQLFSRFSMGMKRGADIIFTTADFFKVIQVDRAFYLTRNRFW
jgi:hypothetical protein